MKPKHQRLLFIAVSVAFLCAATLLTLQAFRENLVFFFSPSDIAAAAPGSITAERHIRVGGLVKNGSVVHGEDSRIEFTISDGQHELNVRYKGLLPNLFREGQGVVAEGSLREGGIFEARTILAKHDETYMPKEVVDALKRSGNWHGDEAP
jgi:cytochrome c-type biogenesis protein CcmE